MANTTALFKKNNEQVYQVTNQFYSLYLQEHNISNRYWCSFIRNASRPRNVP